MTDGERRLFKTVFKIEACPNRGSIYKAAVEDGIFPRETNEEE